MSLAWECKGRYTDETHDSWTCECGASWWNKCPLKDQPAPRAGEQNGAAPQAQTASKVELSQDAGAEQSGVPGPAVAAPPPR